MLYPSLLIFAVASTVISIATSALNNRVAMRLAFVVTIGATFFVTSVFLFSLAVYLSLIFFWVLTELVFKKSRHYVWFCQVLGCVLGFGAIGLVYGLPHVRKVNQIQQSMSVLDVEANGQSFARASFPAKIMPFEKPLHEIDWKVSLQASIFHQSQVQRFADAPGFGVTRIPIGSQWITYEDRQKARAPIRQPGDQFTVPYLEGWVQRSVSDNNERKSQHERVQNDFLSPRHWGFEKEPGKFVDFRSHKVDTEPLSFSRDDLYTLEAVELVGLLMAEQPRVYQTANLPSMTEAKNAPTRPLDAFERKGLDAIAAGETLFAMENQEKKVVRMVGAIRADQNCAKCHEVKNGELLGLFSYTLRAKK